MDIKTFILTSLLNLTSPVDHHNIDVNDLECMSKTVFYEAAKENEVGKVAVGYVILNRLENGKFGDTICEVVHQTKNKSCQFSWVCDKSKGDPLKGKDYDTRKMVFYDCIKASLIVLLGREEDPTHGALYFYSIKLDSTSKLANNKHLHKTSTIGGHVFLK